MQSSPTFQEKINCPIIFSAYPHLIPVFQFLIVHSFPVSFSQAYNLLKPTVMNNYTTHTAQENTNQVWEGFVDYLETIYFDGAAELLNKELIAFEYHQYIETFAV